MVNTIAMESPVVSVVMITYAHEKFIAQAIESILMQECSFPVELIIANDFSPDNSNAIIELYSSKLPANFSLKYLNREKNWGMMPNFLDALRQASGRYIAICEGDDFWTDSKKLQKQVDFLEANPEYSICFHAVNIVYENGIIPFFKDVNEATPETNTIFDLFHHNIIHTMSVLYRNVKDLPNWMETAYPGDWPLHIINATHGKIKFLNENMASYRVHHGGVHSTTGGDDERTLQTFENICIELEKRGLTKEAAAARNEYQDKYATFYGLRKGKNKKYNRFQMSGLLWNHARIKFRLLFWLPLVFGNGAYKIPICLKKITGS